MRPRAFSLPALSALALAALAAGCQSQTVTPFPPGLDALAPDTVPPPGGDDGGNPYPQTLTIVQGSTDAYDDVVATGYVDAPIEAVWAAFKIPAVVVDRHNVSSWTSVPNVESGYDVSFLTEYTINNIITVQFSLTWREGVVAGTEANPTQVSVVYDRTSGSSLVSLVQGSIQLVAVTPSVTELQFVQRMEATDTSSANIAAWTSEMFASVVAQVNGQPLP